MWVLFLLYNNKTNDKLLKNTIFKQKKKIKIHLLIQEEFSMYIL